MESGSGGRAIESRVGTSKGLLSEALSSKGGEGEVVDGGEAEGLSGWPGPSWFEAAAGGSVLRLGTTSRCGRRRTLKTWSALLTRSWYSLSESSRSMLSCLSSAAMTLAQASRYFSIWVVS